MSINLAPLATESRPFATSAASLDPRPPTAASAEANGGDTIAPEPRLLGGAAFGGPLGMASAMVNLAIEDTAGRDIGANALALFDRKAGTPEVMAIATGRTTPLQALVLAQTEATVPARGAAAGSESRSFGTPTTPPIDGPCRLTSAKIAEFVARYERSLPMARTLYESEEGQP